MASNAARWTAIGGHRVPYIEDGQRNGPDVLLVPLDTGLASQDVVWSAIVAVGRAVALGLPADQTVSDCSSGMASSWVIKAIDVFRLRHPHLVASNGLTAVALSTALDRSGALESLILSTDEADWTEIASLMPDIMLPTLIIVTRQTDRAFNFGVNLPRCRVVVLDGDQRWQHCATAVCAWIAGVYRSVSLVTSRS